MPIVHFLPADRSVNVPPGTELLAAAREVNVDLQTPCGGKGACGKCIVRITDGEAHSDSLGLLSAEAVADGYVLACQTRVLNTSLTIDVPEACERDSGQFIEEDGTYLIRTELLPKEKEFDPLTVKWLIHVPPPMSADGLSDLDRLVRAVQRQWGKQEVICSLGAMRRLAGVLRTNDGEVTVTLIRESDKLHVINIEAGDSTSSHHAIAIDVGTTTVAVQLISLPLAKTLAIRSDYNDQVACGSDVISRINYARKSEHLQELRRRVLDTINQLLCKAAAGHGVDPQAISTAVVSGNTTMIHLLLGLDPENIRLDPYTPTVMEVPYLTAAEVGIACNGDAWVCFSPSVGSYVGGDITAGLLCTDLATDSEEIRLFVDIGTNGELVVGNKDFLLGCACSAGPAFEGGGITYGMRAAVGAIEKVEVDADTGRPRYSTIGDTRPIGICGSGMIDLLANLLLTGWIDPAGKFNRTRPSPHIVIEGKRARYVLTRAADSGHGKDISISEQDVENIIRAKAAIYSACALMLDQIGIGFEDLADIYIAGGFGRFLNLDKAIVLGLIPDVPRERFHFIGNASLTGSYMVAVSQEYRRRQLELARRMTYVDLSTTPDYMSQYTGALFLPHTDPERFPSVVAAMTDRGGQA